MPGSTSINVGLIAKALPCAPLWIAQRAGLLAGRGLDVRLVVRCRSSGCGSGRVPLLAHQQLAFAG
jgi:hypothetical protein